MRSADLIVVGAGIVGLATAWQAVQRGLRVAVLERQRRPIGASVRNFGFVTVSGQGPHAHWQRARRTREIWAQIAPQAGIEVLQRGAWFLARRQEAAAVLEAFAASSMGEGCRLLTRSQAQAEAPAVRPGAVLMHSPHELRIEPREAIPRLAAWLESEHGVAFHWGCAVHAIDRLRVHTARGNFEAAHVVVCPGDDLNTLYPQALEAAGIRVCTLQMLRVRADASVRLSAPVLSDLSLLRYAGFAQLPAAQALRERLQREQPLHLEHGVHLIAAQSADGTLVVGDSHVYGDAQAPFAREEIDALILGELRRVLAVEDAQALQVVERWTGSYASLPVPVHRFEPALGVAVGLVTGGTGMSTAFAYAEELLDAALGG